MPCRRPPRICLIWWSLGKAQAEVDVWKPRVDELCVKTASYKLLKQAWLHNACDVMVAYNITNQTFWMLQLRTHNPSTRPTRIVVNKWPKPTSDQRNEELPRCGKYCQKWTNLNFQKPCQFKLQFESMRALDVAPQAFIRADSLPHILIGSAES